MSSKTFAYIWEYKVKEEHLDIFEHIYGPDGDWVKLFKESNGYTATELHKDISEPLHFVTIDYWESKAARDKFKIQYKSEFEKLDRHCAGFTESEKFIGDFECYYHRPDTF